MTEQIILSVITVLGGGAAAWAASWLRERNETRRTTTTVTGEVHKAELESDSQFMDRLIKRVENLEARLLETEQTARKQDEKITELRLTQERIGNQYEANRKLQRRVARHLREGKPIDDDTLFEMENAPEFSHVLAGGQPARALPSAQNGA